MVLNSHSDNQNGFRSASRIQELAQHSQILTDWSLRYDQISKGRFEGNLEEVWLDHAGWESRWHCRMLPGLIVAVN